MFKLLKKNDFQFHYRNLQDKLKTNFMNLYLAINSIGDFLEKQLSVRLYHKQQKIVDDGMVERCVI